MEDKIKVTILVPIYKVEKYVSKCLNSLINQTFKDIQIIAINDGSPDNSEKIVRQFMIKDSRIKLINKKNGGYGSALEVGIAETESKYFMICDPDDWLPEDSVEKLYQVAQRNDLDLVVGDKFNVFEDNLQQVYQPTFPTYLNIKPNKIYENQQDIQKFSFGLVSPHAKLYKTELVTKVTFPHHVSYTDYVLYILALAHTNKVEYINEPLAYYLIDRKGNTNTATRPSIINDYLVGWNSTMNQLSNIDNKDINIIIYRMFVQLKIIISEYSKVIGNNYSNKYFSEICESLNKVRQYRRLIMNVNINSVSVSSKILNMLLLSAFTSKIAVMLLIKKDRK